MAKWHGPTDAAGREHGRGIDVYEDGWRFEGECVDGKRQGQWLITRPDGTREEGAFVDSRRQGRWVVTHAGGKREEGEIVDNFRQGLWIETLADGSRVEQEWRDNKRVGTAMVQQSKARSPAQAPLPPLLFPPFLLSPTPFPILVQHTPSIVPRRL
jgi:hypothetical protein